MEAMLITRSTVVCHFSKPLPNVPSLSLHKPSRVFLASASNQSISYTLATKTRRGVVVMRAAESVSEGVEDIKKAALDANEKAKEVAGSVVDKAKEETDKALAAGESAGEKAKDFASDAKDKTIDESQKVKDAVVGKD